MDVVVSGSKTHYRRFGKSDLYLALGCTTNLCTGGRLCCYAEIQRMSAPCKGEILRLPPQDDIATRSRGGVRDSPMDSRINWLLLINAGLGSFLAGTASRIFAVSLPTVANSLDTTIVGISWAVISFQISHNQFVVGLRPHRGHLRPANYIWTGVGHFRNWCMSVRPFSKCHAAHRVSTFPGHGRLHDAVSGAGVGHGFDSPRSHPAKRRAS